MELIFAEPLNGNIEWRKVEALFLALGAVRTERSGSAVTLFSTVCVLIFIAHTRTRKRCAIASRTLADSWNKLV